MGTVILEILGTSLVVLKLIGSIRLRSHARELSPLRDLVTR